MISLFSSLFIAFLVIGAVHCKPHGDHAHGDDSHSHEDGGHVHGHGLSFFTDLPEEVQEKFEDVWHDHNLKGDEKDRALTRLADDNLNQEQMREFRDHMQKAQQVRAEMESKWMALLDGLSPKVRTAAQKLKDILDDPKMTKSQKKARRRVVFASLQKEEQDELIAFAKRRNEMAGHHEHDGHDHSAHGHAMDAPPPSGAMKHKHAHKHGDMEHTHEHEHANGDMTDHDHSHDHSHDHKHGDTEHSHEHEHTDGDHDHKHE